MGQINKQEAEKIIRKIRKTTEISPQGITVPLAEMKTGIIAVENLFITGNENDTDVVLEVLNNSYSRLFSGIWGTYDELYERMKFLYTLTGIHGKELINSKFFELRNCLHQLPDHPEKKHLIQEMIHFEEIYKKYFLA